MRPVANTFFFFNDTATTEIYTLSLHDALPISRRAAPGGPAADRSAPRRDARWRQPEQRRPVAPSGDRKSTRLNSSHSQISYAVFCLKKKREGDPSDSGSAEPREPDARVRLTRS